MYWVSPVAQWERICPQCGSCRRWRVNTWVSKIPWRKARQSNSVFLTEEPHGQRSLVGSSPRGLKASDTTEQACMRMLTVQSKNEGTATPRCIPAKSQKHHGKWSQNTSFTILRETLRKTAQLLRVVTSETVFTKTGRDGSGEAVFLCQSCFGSFLFVTLYIIKKK